MGRQLGFPLCTFTLIFFLLDKWIRKCFFSVGGGGILIELVVGFGGGGGEGGGGGYHLADYY